MAPPPWPFSQTETAGAPSTQPSLAFSATGAFNPAPVLVLVRRNTAQPLMHKGQASVGGRSLLCSWPPRSSRRRRQGRARLQLGSCREPCGAGPTELGCLEGEAVASQLSGRKLREAALSPYRPAANYCTKQSLFLLTILQAEERVTIPWNQAQQENSLPCVCVGGSKRVLAPPKARTPDWSALWGWVPGKAFGPDLLTRRKSPQVRQRAPRWNMMAALWPRRC